MEVHDGGQCSSVSFWPNNPDQQVFVRACGNGAVLDIGG
jgi:hypothetical protein